ncbi:TPM domain-containing protein [Sulfurirhabdus autotrophica]|uniref:TLP18.3/Psb32/MOLO-1 phosphatase superfamily protein n=1 Tax=Sulfurirhabdus autotrophica TaxID=1706046 RepID=A0A4R3YE29_9PROT|nr:TPM domain-containing protein [Sulfurirhabdus autotrophica]TCV90326.1 TLP18.3/Psb32/MOLO-1 phosphatase superfamily protein [Sulfurirhabdus autotrophica]
MNLMRIIKHLLTDRWAVRRAFPAHAMQAIEDAIRLAEKTHQGQIRFAVEASLDMMPLLKGQTARERSIEVFSQMRVWDTAQNNGILIYLLFADHDFEIVADRGIHAHVGHDGWEVICQKMELAFKQMQFEAGVITGIKAVSEHLIKHYPGKGANANELSDTPVLL